MAGLYTFSLDFLEISNAVHRLLTWASAWSALQRLIGCVPPGHLKLLLATLGCAEPLTLHADCPQHTPGLARLASHIAAFLLSINLSMIFVVIGLDFLKLLAYKTVYIALDSIYN